MTLVALVIEVVRGAKRVLVERSRGGLCPYLSRFA